jgi:tetratricopeptide (TPR) repeat protein
MKRKVPYWCLSPAFLCAVILFSFYLSGLAPSEKKHPFQLLNTQHIKMVSGSFQPLLAQGIFVKGILDLHEKIPQKAAYLSNLFLTSFSLDPRLVQSCFFAGVVLPENREEIIQAIAFLKAARAINPDTWRIPYWIGFNYYLLQDYLSAASYYRIASECKDSPGFLITNQAALYYLAGKPQAALLYYQGLLHSVKDSRQLELIQLKMLWLNRLVSLQEAVETFKGKFSRWPQELEELVEAKIMDRIPEDVFGKGYYLEQVSDDTGAKVRVKSRL